MSDAPRVRAFTIRVEDGKKIVFIPELLKMFLVDAGTNVPASFAAPRDYVAPSYRAPDGRFRRVDLIINNFCNLRCRYCFAEAGDRAKQEMSIDVAERAIDCVVATCREDGASSFAVTLTGGGEPILSFELVKKIVVACRKREQQSGLRCRLGLVSNGTFGRRVGQYVARNFDSVSFSVDGCPEVHDYHRPTVDGRGSFATLADNIDALLGSGTVGTAFRMTISDRNVAHLDEHVLYLHNRWPGVVIGLEPVEQTGRCHGTGTNAPDPMAFARSFVRTMKVAKEHGILLRHAVATFKAIPDHFAFCGINGRIFGVDPLGNVTSCTRVVSSCDRLAPLFHYGSYDALAKGFVIDPAAYARNGRYLADEIPGCMDCFARANCRGDCCHLRASAFGVDFGHRRSPKCLGNRALTLGLLRMELGLRELTPDEYRAALVS